MQRLFPPNGVYLEIPEGLLSLIGQFDLDAPFDSPPNRIDAAKHL